MGFVGRACRGCPEREWGKHVSEPRKSNIFFFQNRKMDQIEKQMSTCSRPHPCLGGGWGGASHFVSLKKCFFLRHDHRGTTIFFVTGCPTENKIMCTMCASTMVKVCATADTLFDVLFENLFNAVRGNKLRAASIAAKIFVPRPPQINFFCRCDHH